ncbi:MAG: sulfatase-like hydrolase/transferase [Candidatus Hydrogenedentes bacterium]|nr:sulfatase-like hydrolase/transferase [Candidatus Hydrogenedentota bacterium]
MRYLKLILLTLSGACSGLAAVADAPPAAQPNILFIIADDQAPGTLRAYGNTICQTPNLDRLSAEGMTFDGAHHMGSWVGAVCRPSRTMIMTGRSLWHIPGKGNPYEGDASRIPADIAEQTLPAVFNRAGYDTFRSCKLGNSYDEANKRFKTVKDQTCREGNTAEGSAWHADQVLNYLAGREAAKPKAPFLIYLGFSHPHDPRNGTPELLAKYGARNDWDPAQPGEANPAAPPLPDSWLPAHPFPHGHPELRDEVAVQGVMTARDPATVRNETGREYACIENIDQQVGRVLAKLEAMGELDNTYIFYTSDHGMSVGRHGLMGKQNLYEHTWRVPFVVRGPGIESGSRALGNIYLMDVLPTLCDLAGVAAPPTVEGQSFRPVLEGKAGAIREVLYGVYSGGTQPGMRAVKQGDWKLIKYDTMEGQVRETQLFNLSENPEEYLLEHHAPEVIAATGHTPNMTQVDLAEDPRYADDRVRMEALLQAEMKRWDDPATLWNQK